MGGSESPQGSGQQRTPDSLLPWQWPQSNDSGPRSSNTSDEPSRPAEQGNQQQALISRNAIATTIVAAVPTIVSLVVAFGCHLSNEQQLAIPAAVASVTAVVLAVRAGMRRRR